MAGVGLSSKIPLWTYFNFFHPPPQQMLFSDGFVHESTKVFPYWGLMVAAMV